MSSSKTTYTNEELYLCVRPKEAPKDLFHNLLMLNLMLMKSYTNINNLISFILSFTIH